MIKRLQEHPVLERNESGNAMIIAITVVMIAAMLTIAEVSNSVHQLTGVTETNQQVTTVQSAEGGVDLAVSQMQSAATLSALPCGIPGSLTSNPLSAKYTVAITYYDSSGNSLTCPTPTSDETYYGGATTPTTALIRSQGSSNSSEYGAQSMEAEVELNSNVTTGAFFNGAVFSNSAMTWINKTTIASSSGSGDVYSNGAFVCNNVSTISGDVLVNGNFTATNQCNTTGSWEVNGYVNDPKGSTVGKNIVASGSGTCSTGYQVCLGNAAGSVAGYVEAAGNVTSNETVTGGIQQGLGAAVPTPTFPAFHQYDFKSSDWCGATEAVGTTTNCTNGYKLIEESNNGCTQAESDIQNMSSATRPTVIYVPGTCTVTFGGSLALTLPQNLIVFAEGGFKFQNTVNVTSTGGTELYLVVPYNQGDGGTGSQVTCTGSNPSVPGEYFVNKLTLPTTNFYTFMYTPCTIWLNNNGAIAGQLYGGDVKLVNQVSFTDVNPNLPNQGSSGTNLFDVALLYDRQITP